MRACYCSVILSSLGVPSLTVGQAGPLVVAEPSVYVIVMDLGVSHNKKRIAEEVDGFSSALQRVVPDRFGQLVLGIEAYSSATTFLFDLKLIKDQADLDGVIAALETLKTDRNSIISADSTQTGAAIVAATSAIANSQWSTVPNRQIFVAVDGTANGVTQPANAAAASVLNGNKVGCVTIVSSTFCDWVTASGGEELHASSYLEAGSELEANMLAELPVITAAPTPKPVTPVPTTAKPETPPPETPEPTTAGVKPDEEETGSGDKDDESEENGNTDESEEEGEGGENLGAFDKNSEEPGGPACGTLCIVGIVMCLLIVLILCIVIAIVVMRRRKAKASATEPISEETAATKAEPTFQANTGNPIGAARTVPVSSYTPTVSAPTSPQLLFSSSPFADANGTPHVPPHLRPIPEDH